MKFAELVEGLQQLEKTASRNLMTEILAELFKATSEAEIQWVCYLGLGELRPAFDRLESQLADKMVARGLAEAFGVEVTEVWGEYKKAGDLGLVALRLAQGKLETKKKLSVTEVYEKLVEMAREGGEGSQERKLGRLVALIHQLEPLSVKYVIRIILGKLRLGFSDMTILDALAVMDQGTKAGREALEQYYQVFPDVGRLAQLVKQVGVGGLAGKVRVELGVPVMPALCQRLKTADEMVEKMGRVIVEPKFDGTRVQIHIRKRQDQWRVKTFTRNLDETTAMFPELVGIEGQIKAREVILDSEAVGVDPKTGKYLPFQETITRKRKYQIESVSQRIPLKFMVFDILYQDGESLMRLSLKERKRRLRQIMKDSKALKITEYMETENPEEVRQYHARQIKAGLEGVVVKQVGSSYEPGRRGWSWVKFKEAETSVAKLADTLDPVVMGFYRGKGKRASLGIGAFLVGVRHQGRIVTIAKIGTGLTDEQWGEIRRRLERQVAMVKPKEYVVHKTLEPDVWVDPQVVVEIAADEITKSPVHSAGWALRFPRLVRFRDDKTGEQATSWEELLAIQKASK